MDFPLADHVFKSGLFVNGFLGFFGTADLFAGQPPLLGAGFVDLLPSADNRVFVHRGNKP